MDMFSKVRRFGLHHVCVVAIACAAFADQAAGQRSDRREDKDQIDAESSSSDDEKALLKVIEEQRRAAEAQRAEATEQYRRAMSEIERVRRRGSTEAQAELAKAKEQLALARARLEVAANPHQMQQAQAEPLPEDTILRIYHLQHVKPQNLAAVLAPIFRNNAPRISIDDRSNALLVAGNERQLSIVEELAQTLDREIPEIAQEQNKQETLQVRIVWLLDINDGMEPTDKLVSPQVVEALGELGFEHPKVVCQQVATLTLGNEDDSRRGQFDFMVPVLIQSQPWQLQGQGEIAPVAGQRFNLKFDLHFHQVVPQGGGRSGRQGQLGGSIYTPLGHYTVMGTTTFVAQTPAPLPDDSQPGEFGTGGVVQNQHLSAFVVYLDRAREFPASGAQSEERNDGRRR
jgi:Bacterial type II/III secretion system short domain